MAIEPCHAEYDLNRRQRLVAHLGVWGRHLAGLGFIAAVSIALTISESWWFAVLLVFPLWFTRGFLAGVIDVIFVGTRHIDIDIAEDHLAWTGGAQRFFIFLDGVTLIRRYSSDTWTVLFNNGTVINIPVHAIEGRYIDHMRKMGEWGKTPEGVQAAIKRGKRIVYGETDSRDHQQVGHAEDSEAGGNA